MKIEDKFSLFDFEISPELSLPRETYTFFEMKRSLNTKELAVLEIAILQVVFPVALPPKTMKKVF